MGLKQSIVVVNEFTVKTPKGGTRGSSPKNYIVDYMARDNAAESVTPRQTEQSDYIERYMLRESAVEAVQDSEQIDPVFKKLDGFAGKAFGNGRPSLSHDALVSSAEEIQRLYDEGHTVMKTVLSFDEEYLRSTGIIDPGFYLARAGDYQGNIDQMKLRMAVMSGLEKMSKDYDDLKYVGTIQTDTKHVHVHLCMADAGVGTLAADGTQKGKISEKSKTSLRRGIDMFLDENQTVRQMSSDFTQNKRNSLCFVKKFTHQAMKQEGQAQFLISCLPDDKRLWRADSNSKAMKKANYVVREYVSAVLQQPGSGYGETLRSIDAYAQGRQKREGLTDQEYRKLYQDGQERVIRDCMNGVYGILKNVPEHEMQVRTPMLDIMSQDYDDMAGLSSSDPMVEFGFKLRSYSSRIDHHKRECHKYREMKEAYNATPEKAAESAPLLDFIKFEEEYNAALMSKYQHFLAFLPPEEEYKSEFDSLMGYRTDMLNYGKLIQDPSAKRMSAMSAEDYGERVYGVHGGRFVASAPRVAERRLHRMEETYAKKEEAFRDKIADYGLSMESGESGVAVKAAPRHDFNEVKALDLHHMGYDFTYDISISKPNVETFIETAEKRLSLYMGAREYLELSGQADKISVLPEKDVFAMAETAGGLRTQAVLPSSRPSSGGKSHAGRTVRLDANYRRTIDMAIKSTVQSVQFDTELGE